MFYLPPFRLLHTSSSMKKIVENIRSLREIAWNPEYSELKSFWEGGGEYPARLTSYLELDFSQPESFGPAFLRDVPGDVDPTTAGVRTTDLARAFEEVIKAKLCNLWTPQ